MSMASAAMVGRLACWGHVIAYVRRGQSHRRAALLITGRDQLAGDARDLLDVVEVHKVHG